MRKQRVLGLVGLLLLFLVFLAKQSVMQLGTTATISKCIHNLMHTMFDVPGKD